MVHVPCALSSVWWRTIIKSHDKQPQAVGWRIIIKTAGSGGEKSSKEATGSGVENHDQNHKQWGGEHSKDTTSSCGVESHYNKTQEVGWTTVRNTTAVGWKATAKTTSRGVENHKNHRQSGGEPL